MKMDVVKEVAEELNIPFQELLYPVGIDNALKEPIKQSTSYEFHTMSDVINALFAITELTDFSFELTNTKPPEILNGLPGLRLTAKAMGNMMQTSVSLWKTG